jgi:hypothetical protein
VVNRLDFMYSANIREHLVINNVHDYLTFIQRFSLPKSPRDTWTLTHYPLLIVYLKVNTTFKRKKEKKDKKNRKDDKKKDSYVEEDEKVTHYY